MFPRDELSGGKCGILEDGIIGSNYGFDLPVGFGGLALRSRGVGTNLPAPGTTSTALLISNSRLFAIFPSRKMSTRYLPGVQRSSGRPVKLTRFCPSFVT